MSRLCMTRMYKRCTFARVTFGIWLVALAWNEYLQYLVMSWRWSSLDAAHTRSDDVLDVLLVSDPQLIGLQDEKQWVGPITRWDADRYLSKTFRLAQGYLNPDVIVFLGDLLDEGSHATPDEYNSYMERFTQIFNIPQQTQAVYIPGDNDIGGEGFDRKEPHKIASFNSHFLPDQIPPKDVISVKFVDFLRLDLMPEDVAAARIQQQLVSLRQQSSSLYRILCNHVSIIDRWSRDQNDIITKTGADLILSGHTHTSDILVCTDCGPVGPRDRQWKAYQGQRLEVYDHKVYHLSLTQRDQIYEIRVPTCSYRMGVRNMGYGAARFDKNGHVSYTVLWLPERYVQLASYVVLLVLTFISTVVMVGILVAPHVCRCLQRHLAPYWERYAPIYCPSLVTWSHKLKILYYRYINVCTFSVRSKLSDKEKV